MNGFFVTGTDTGVGKTTVTSAIARRGRALGLRMFAFKPVETGCERSGALGPDQAALCEAAGGWQQGPLRGIYQLASPVAPAVAAEEERRTIDLAEIEARAREGATQADVTLVEGAGGWRVPVTPTEDIGGVAKRLGLPVIVVARASLGTINHSVLTLEAVQRDGCSVAALVMSRRPDEDPAFAQSNAQQIARWWKGLVLTYEGDDNALDPLFHMKKF